MRTHCCNRAHASCGTDARMRLRGCVLRACTRLQLSDAVTERRYAGGWRFSPRMAGAAKQPPSEARPCETEQREKMREHLRRRLPAETCIELAGVAAAFAATERVLFRRRAGNATHLAKGWIFNISSCSAADWAFLCAKHRQM